MKEIFCTRCGDILNDDTAFPSVLKDGGGRCKSCHRKAMKATYDKNPEKARRMSKERRDNYPEIYRRYVRSVEGRHNTLRKRLTKDDPSGLDLLWNINFYRALIADFVCHYCQGPLTLTGHGLDRKDSSIGHLAHNVVPCCRSCNTKKMNDTTYEEMLLLVPGLREIRRLRTEALHVDQNLPVVQEAVGETQSV
jgi:hypothetical protein